MEFTGDLTRLVADQLATGRYRGREDSAPGDWLARAWHALPADERPRLTAAIHAALTHADPQVRVEAVRLLDGNPRMADPERLLDLVEQHWDLFKGLRSPLDPPGVDRGSDLVRLVADRASGSRGTHFRKNMSRDPVYGIHVLAALADEEPDVPVRCELHRLHGFPHHYERATAHLRRWDPRRGGLQDGRRADHGFLEHMLRRRSGRCGLRRGTR